MTYTYSEMAVPLSVYEEIAVRLKDAGYDQAFVLDDNHEQPTLDMHGIGITVENHDMTDNNPRTRVEVGQVAYDAYCEETGGKSAVTGDTLPAWDNLSTNIQDAWNAAGEAVELFLEIKGR